MLKEFKKFAFKGNVIDMAVGVVIGSAFGKIVSSLVNDIIMPSLGAVIGGIDLKDRKWVLSVMEDGTENAVLYGSFIMNIIDFFIIAFSIFIFIWSINKVKNRFKKEEKAVAEPPKGPSTEELLAEIRDLMKEKNG